MASKTYSAAVIGLDAVPVETEADISQGLPNFVIVGLPDASVQEARERVKTALKNSGLPFPRTRLTVNLAPADIRKEGPAYDLPIAVAICLAGNAAGGEAMGKRLFIGELALDGSLRPVSGALPIAIMALERGFEELFLPEGNAEEAALVCRRTGENGRALHIYPVRHLPQLIGHLRGETAIQPYQPAPETNATASGNEAGSGDFDFAYIKGQMQAKRALEIAAAGGHNLLFSGPPGAGKTLLARSLPSILPPMDPAETLEVTKIYSVAGLTGHGRLVTERPFRSPHHTASGAALIGGGSWPKPGEVSLAHRGVLFLDEFPEFSRAVLENLRQPLEDGFVTISRAQSSLRFPAKFILVAAQNPCPCGYASDPDVVCSCPPAQVVRYRKKISGPLLDRIDLHVEVPKMNFVELFSKEAPEPSAAVRRRVEAARAAQTARFRGAGIFTNSEMNQKMLKRFCALDDRTETLLRAASERLRLSARAYARVIKIARTVADLDGAAEIGQEHAAEALHFRERQ
jgi:magnesium chelatase family protein